MYVYHAQLSIKWEEGWDLGLFHKKSDAKKACQDEAKDGRLAWDNSDPHRSFANVPGPVLSDGLFVVTRRPVK